MVWRHPEATIDDPRPAAGSFNIADVRRLSTYVMKLRDMPEGVLVLSGLSQVWKNFIDIHDFLCLPEWTSSRKSPNWMLGRPFKGFPFIALLLL
uniref:Uncharacterized protein n=1 Tax=Tanacetum cinerariifolium TaxID=118510 RepID=A0A699UN94_TANCI|nr:hypothetical protein [Tanacetum cinerariifolium]